LDPSVLSERVVMTKRTTGGGGGRLKMRVAGLKMVLVKI